MQHAYDLRDTAVMIIIGLIVLLGSTASCVCWKASKGRAGGAMFIKHTSIEIQNRPARSFSCTCDCQPQGPTIWT